MPVSGFGGEIIPGMGEHLRIMSGISYLDPSKNILITRVIYFIYGN